MKKDLTIVRLIIFGVLATIFLAIFSFLYSKNKDADYLTIMMLTPLISVVLTRIFTKEGLKNLFLKPNFKKNKKYYLMAYLLTPFIAYTGALIYFILFPNQLDILGSKFSLTSDITSNAQFFKQFITIFPLVILINPLFNIISCFGEEFAWRGYLLPKLLQKFSTLKAVTLTGIIWGLWHAPIIAMGFNYGTEHPFLGILTMIFFCIVINTILSYLFLKTNSLWTVVIVHAAINALDLAAPSYLFMSRQPNLFIGPNLTGLIGGIGFTIIAILCYAKLRKMTASFIKE